MDRERSKSTESHKNNFLIDIHLCCLSSRTITWFTLFLMLRFRSAKTDFGKLKIRYEL